MLEIILAVIAVTLFLATWLWQNPGMIRGRLREREISDFMKRVEALPFPGEARPEVLRRMRNWLESDDGKPFTMLNLMRYHAELRRFPDGPSFEGTPRECNAHYEASVRKMLLKVGGYPLYAGTPAGPNLLEHAPALDNWSRLLLVRYPSRRSFMKLITHPAYAPLEPYKLMAMLVVLTPTSPEIAIPNVTFLVGSILLLILLAIGWARAAGVFS
jgi:hypothetical protein